jgi:hypothetical protein
MMVESDLRKGRHRSRVHKRSLSDATQCFLFFCFVLSVPSQSSPVQSIILTLSIPRFHLQAGLHRRDQL